MRNRSKLSAVLLCAAMCLGAGGTALAQDYPTKPVRLVVPNPPGGTTDILSRLVAEELTKTWPHPVVVEYKSGGAGYSGADFAAKSDPDGYTIIMQPASHATGPSIYKDLPYDPIADFAPVTLVASVPNVLIVNPDVPANSVEELIVLAKSKPGDLNFGSGGIGAITHLSGELFKQSTGVEMVHIPYAGSAPAITDLLGGQIEMMFENLPGAMGHIQAGRLRPLAVTSPERAVALPDVPTVAEAGVPGYEAVSWFGILAPAGTPEEIIDKLNTDIVAVIKKPEIQARLIELGTIPGGNTPEEFAAFIQAELDKWTKVITAAGIEPK